VQIPGYPANKLNHAYQYGGMSLLCETLLVNFGVEIDGAIEINFSSFQEIIDMLGGVEISLTEKEAKYMNHPSKWGLTAGVNRLNGEQALLYARLREIDSDYQRSERQRTVLLALVSAYKNQPVGTMLGLLDDIMPLLTTNMTNEQMWSYSLKVVTMLAGARYNSQRIPADGTFSQGNVQVRPGLKAWFQYNIDFDANRELLRKIIEE
jgi:LCP family protein required for cell wall assembly